MKVQNMHIENMMLRQSSVEFADSIMAKYTAPNRRGLTLPPLVFLEHQNNVQVEIHRERRMEQNNAYYSISAPSISLSLAYIGNKQSGGGEGIQKDRSRVDIDKGAQGPRPLFLGSDPISFHSLIQSLKWMHNDRHDFSAIHNEKYQSLYKDVIQSVRSIHHLKHLPNGEDRTSLPGLNSQIGGDGISFPDLKSSMIQQRQAKSAANIFLPSRAVHLTKEHFTPKSGLLNLGNTLYQNWKAWKENHFLTVLRHHSMIDSQSSLYTLEQKNHNVKQAVLLKKQMGHFSNQPIKNADMEFAKKERAETHVNPSRSRGTEREKEKEQVYVRSESASTPSQNIDLNRLSEQVYQVIERKLKIERQRKGL